MYRDLIKDLEKKSDEVIERLKEEFGNIHTGRANASLVENIIVTYYGQKTQLKQMASINIPDANMIVVSPWDANALGDIENAIRNSETGFNPVNDGKSVRIALPPLTEERRNEFVKMIQRMSEEAKIVIRTAREDVWKNIKDMEKKKELTEDDKYASEKELNNLTKKYNDEIEKMADIKSQELLKV